MTDKEAIEMLTAFHKSIHHERIFGLQLKELLADEIEDWYYDYMDKLYDK
jgi:hypothetical protein